MVSLSNDELLDGAASPFDKLRVRNTYPVHRCTPTPPAPVKGAGDASMRLRRGLQLVGHQMLGDLDSVECCTLAQIVGDNPE
jgi:hypothetical protein